MLEKWKMSFLAPVLALLVFFVASPALAQDMTVTVAIDATLVGEEGVDTKTLAIPSGSTALDALSQAYEATIVESSFGPYVTAIQGHSHPDGGWIFTVNEEAPTVGASQVILADGDKVAWTLILFTPSEPTPPAYSTALKNLQAYVQGQEEDSPWHAIALAQSQGETQNLVGPAVIRADQALASRKWTDKAKSILELMALGRHGQAERLVGQLAQGQDLQAQGNNALIYGLLALSAYDQEGLYGETLKTWTDLLVAGQNPDGSFSFTNGQDGDVDMTAMALQALAASPQPPQASMDKAIAYLAQAQNPSGDFSNYGIPTAESTAQVLIALISAGIDPAADGRFLKEGHGTLDGLLAYQLDNGAFAHEKGGEANLFATEQAHLALVAYDRQDKGQGSLWTFPKKAILLPFADKEDISLWAQEDLFAAYEKGLVSGYPDATFKPQAPVSRAEATVLLARVYGWGVADPTLLPFKDVPADAWYGQVLAGAHLAGYAAGVASDAFAPDTPVDRQSFAVLMSRAYDLPTTQIYYTFADDNLIAPWAVGGVQTVMNAKLMVGTSADTFSPQDPITREQAAVILNRLDTHLKNRVILEDAA